MNISLTQNETLYDALHQILPDEFRSVIETSCPSANAKPGCVQPCYTAIVHLDCKTADDCDRWILAFGKSSYTTWRTRNTYPKGRRGLVYRKDYVCQHSDFNKSCHDKYKKTKDTACPAKLIIKIREITRYNKKDTYLAQDLPCIVSLSWIHNHGIKTAQALSYRDASQELQDCFITYFNEGMTPSAALKYHTDCLEMANDFTEESLADASKNPLAFSVYRWHDSWRKRNLGGRSGDSMLDVLKLKVPVWLATCGARVAYQQNPFAVVILTPIMARAHSVQFARDICFVDSTASCDADNHMITFLLAPTVAGAVPLGVIITDSSSEASYTAGFQLFKIVLPNDCFGGIGYPAVFMTDDSDAERNALQTCWPQSSLKLCLFHVPQAVWRWLWSEAHGIAKEDRKTLMTEFRKIMYSLTEDEAGNAFEEAFNSETAVEYRKYQDYLKGWWQRRELWCIPWRNASQRGHHTNNFAEVTVRLYKDVVLGRCKAYNAVALVDFTVRVMEDYYRMRLRDFVNGRVSVQRLLLEKLSTKSAYLHSCDQMSDLGDNKYGVPNSDGTELYYVDSGLGCCTCPEGITGKFCKHQAAVMRLFRSSFPNSPGVTAEARYSIAQIAFGDSCQTKAFYADIGSAIETTEMPAHSADCSGPIPQNEFPITSSADKSINEQHEQQQLSRENNRMQEFLQLVTQNYSRFGSEPMCQEALRKAIVRMKSVNTACSFASFFHSGGGFRRYRAGATIHVQPTSLSRRRPGITRGSKKLPCGRPPAGCGPKRKRRRCLAENVAANVPNAKSHGYGH